MTNKQHPAQFDWATELSDAQGSVTLSAQEANEIGARLRSMGEKLKAYEDLDEAASDVQLLCMGYAAARLEIESLKAQLHAAKQINAAQFTLLAASIPGAALRPPHGQAPASKIDGLTAAQEPLGVEFEKVLHDNLFDLYEESAPHWQAPAQAAQKGGA